VEFLKNSQMKFELDQTNIFLHKKKKFQPKII